MKYFMNYFYNVIGSNSIEGNNTCIATFTTFSAAEEFVLNDRIDPNEAIYFNRVEIHQLHYGEHYSTPSVISIYNFNVKRGRYIFVGDRVIDSSASLPVHLNSTYVTSDGATTCPLYEYKIPKTCVLKSDKELTDYKDEVTKALTEENISINTDYDNDHDPYTDVCIRISAKIASLKASLDNPLLTPEEKLKIEEEISRLNRYLD